MKRKFLCIPLLCAISARVNAQVARSPSGAFYTETETYSTHSSPAFSSAFNQAALAAVPSFSAGVYGERRFWLQDLSFYKTAVALPSAAGNFGFNLDYFGGSVYHSSRLGIGYGRKLADKISAGVQFNYHSIKTSGYSQAATITIEGGMIFLVTDQLHAGFHVFNPLRSGFSKESGEQLPVLYTAGLGYDLSENFSVDALLKKEEDQKVNALATCRYAFDKKLVARLGVSTTEGIFLLGGGVVLDDFRLEVSASIHPTLGVTPGLMIIYNQASK